jgi:hypothetical protein
MIIGVFSHLIGFTGFIKIFFGRKLHDDLDFGAFTHSPTASGIVEQSRLDNLIWPIRTGRFNALFTQTQSTTPISFSVLSPRVTTA